MGFPHHSELMHHSDRALAGASYDPKKLVLTYAGATAAVMLLTTVASYLLDSHISGTGGLSGLAMRSMLETAIQVLQTGVSLIVPFWTFGYLSCMLKISRGQNFTLSNLADGFRHFGPVLRLTLIRWGYFLLLAMLCLYPSMMIFLWTPLSQPFQAILEPYIGGDTTQVVLDDATLNAATETLLPMFLIYAVIYLAIAAPKFYSYRMAEYCLMDNPKAGALMAIRRSGAMLHKKRLALLKLDLRFWWFYLLDGLTMALCYGDTLLALVGISLPMDQQVAYFAFYLLYLIGQLALYVWAKNKVECTYAGVYEGLKAELDEKLRQLMAEQTEMNNPQDE